MKRLIPVFLILICAAASAESFNVSDYKGQVVYLDFWASWCGPCRASFPWMNTIQKRYQSQGLQVIAVNLDQESELAADFLKQFPASFTIFYDPEGVLAQQYKVTSMPHSFLIDRSGQLVSSHKGFRQSKKAEYEQEIQALLAEE
ncbi:MAG: TlpA disulfide reductase family protein [Reinekea sp.]